MVYCENMDFEYIVYEPMHNLEKHDQLIFGPKFLTQDFPLTTQAESFK